MDKLIGEYKNDRGFCLQDGAFAFRDKIVSLEDGSMDYYHGDEKIGEGKWSAGGI